VSVLQKLFHQSTSAVSPPAVTATTGERPVPNVAIAEPADAVSGYVDTDDALLHDPGAPPHWAPECGTPAFSTRHRCG
jgi:hypothetical protein